MKHNLGKMFIFLLAAIILQAEDFNYTFSLDKNNPYVKEAVILTLEINQTNHDKVLLFNFDLKESDNYRFQRLDSKEMDTYHDLKARYIYLVYPLHSGDVNITFDLIKKVTSDDSLTYSFSGDRDNIKQLVTVDTTLKLPPLTLKVKALPLGTLLVGDFNITHNIKKHKAKAYEPLPFQISIKGSGYPPLLDTLLPKDGNFTRFTEKPVVSSSASTKGTQNSVTYPMALSHSKSFELPALLIKSFNPQTEKSYELTVPAQYFDITKAEVTTLIDTIDSPEVLKIDWSWLSNLLSYFVVFATGYLSALSWKWKKRTLSKKENPLKEKIQNCKDEKSLLQVLMSVDSKRFNPSIEKLEASLYGNGKINLNKVKKEAEEQI